MNKTYIVIEDRIEPVPPEVEDGLSWRDAKKALREFYLNKAASLRTVTEDTYFNK